MCNLISSMIYGLCDFNTSADLCMGWVPPGDFVHPDTAAAPRVAHVWGAPAGRPERPDSFWRWCSTPHSSAGVTLRVNRTQQISQPWCFRGKNDKNKEWITSSTDNMHSFHSCLTCHSFGRTGFVCESFPPLGIQQVCKIVVFFKLENFVKILIYFSSHPDL